MWTLMFLSLNRETNGKKEGSRPRIVMHVRVSIHDAPDHVNRCRHLLLVRARAILLVTTMLHLGIHILMLNKFITLVLLDDLYSSQRHNASTFECISDVT